MINNIKVYRVEILLKGLDVMTPISDEFAEYALNLVVTNIVLSVGIYKRGK